MAQLPRCVQQAPWKRVSGVCALTIRSLSFSASSSLKCCSAIAGGTSASSSSAYALRPSQSVLILCGSSQKFSRSVQTNLTCDRLRFVLRRAPVPFANSLISRNSSFGSSDLPALGSFSPRSFSSADASTVVHGEGKDAQKTLLAEIEAKERELEQLRNSLRRNEDASVTVNGHESDASPSIEDPPVQVSSAAAEHVVSEESSTDGTTSLPALEEEEEEEEEEEDVGQIEENATVIYLADPNLKISGSPTAEEEAVKERTSEVAVGGDKVLDSTSTNHETAKTPVEHPWPQWTRFLKHLAKGNYFANEEGKEIDITSVSPDDYGLIKRGCLNFARERDDIFTGFAQKDLEIIARFGCPTTDRKVVNAGKRLREYLKIDEVSICKPCALRPSCERADFRVASDHVAGTPEVIRLLSQYALNVSPDSERDLKIPELVQKSCTNLLQQAVTLGSKARDPKLPKFERKAEMVKSDREDRMGRRGDRVERGAKRRGDADVEMKPGDWKCPQCEYVNFARNRNCRECDARRPAPELRPGDWTCPECDFLNFSRNRECHDCKAERPPGVGFDAFKKGGRGDREGRVDGGDRRYGRERESRESERGSSRYDSRGDRDRGSYDRSDRSRERGSERGMDRRSRDGEELDSYDRRSPRRDGDRGSFDRRSAATEERGGRRNKYEEWKPDLSKKDEFIDDSDDEDNFSRKRAKGRKDDDDEELDDLDLDIDDDEDLEDVEAFDDDEFEDLRSSASRSSKGSGDRTRVGRSFERDSPRWEDDRSSRSSGRGGSRGGSGGNRGYDRGDADSWSSSSSRGGRRGGGRGATRGRGGGGGPGRR